MDTSTWGDNWTAPGTGSESADSPHFPGLFADAINEQLQATIERFQEWICELLMKNQQLRMTLTEIKARTEGASIDLAVERARTACSH